MLTENLKDLMQKPMDRKDFIKHIGVGLIALTGVATFVGSLTGREGVSRLLSQQNDDSAYGATVYGGKQDSATSRSL